MTTKAPAETLEAILRDNDLGWLIDLFTPRERAIPVLLNKLDLLTVAYKARFGHDQSFSPETLRREAERNPHKVRAFLQALRASNNAEMLLMVWRILQGLGIREISMTYRERAAFHLVVVLSREDEEQEHLEKYESNDVNDAVLLKHFGIATLDGQPLFTGFFPDRKRRLA